MARAFGETAARATGPHLTYRPDIDGLRAIAVAPVVLFHFRLGPFGGGFVGVDIFFVISGFLITALIRKAIVEGRFSLTDFYERRVRRIFPALFVVLALSTALAFAVFLPEDLDNFGKTLGSTALFASNMELLREADYFDRAADLKPLLHTWSLAVEEQFYLVFPPLMMLAARWSRGALLAALGVLAIASLALGLWILSFNPPMAFYIAPARAWEVLLGAMLAVGTPAPPRSRLTGDLISLAALGAIAWSILGFSSEALFPGPNALLGCCGAAALLYVGAAPRAPIGSRALASPPMVFIGRISYSLYLWHWPLLVFASYYALDGLGWTWKAALIALAVGLSAVTERFVERPFRGAASRVDRRTAFALGGGAMAAAIALAAVAVVAKGFPGRLPAEARTDLAVTGETRAGHCPAAPPPGLQMADLCGLGHAAGARPDFLLWGDSLATALSPAVEAAADQRGRTGWFVQHNGCVPLPGVDRVGFPACRRFNAAAMRLALSPEVKEVILVGRWALAADGVEYGDPGRRLEVLSSATAGADLAGDNRKVFAPALEALASRLRAAGKRVVLVHSSPEIGRSVPQTLAKARLLGRSIDLDPPESAYLARQAYVLALFDRLRATQGVEIIRPDSLLCAGGHCRVAVDGRPIYYDDHHLNRRGALILTPLLARVM
jgi:peptidoglycan/LPS O-acetylase OafA/YrhL